MSKQSKKSRIITSGNEKGKGIYLADGSRAVSKPRVLVGIAAGDGYIDPRTYRTMRQAVHPFNDTFEASQMDVIGAITDDARNEIAKAAISQNYDYIFFMDTDMVFPSGVLERFIELADNREVVIGGLYNHRKDYRIHAYKWDIDKQEYRSISGHIDDDFDLNTDLYRVDALGTGCMLIPTSIFSKLEFPYFQYKYEDGKRWSEDIYFCRKLNKLNIPIYVDTNTVCGHLQMFVIYQADRINFQISDYE